MANWGNSYFGGCLGIAFIIVAMGSCSRLIENDSLHKMRIRLEHEKIMANCEEHQPITKEGEK